MSVSGHRPQDHNAASASALPDSTAALLACLFPHSLAGQHAHILHSLTQHFATHLQQRRLFVTLVTLLNWQCRLRFGQPLNTLAPDTAARWLTRAQQKKSRALLLKLIALPLKFLWLQYPELHQKLGSRVQLPPVKAERLRWQQQISSLSDCGLDDGLTVDAIVIGSGAGGAVAAYELARQGLAVVMVEEGAYYDRSHFNGNVPQLLKKLYRRLGLTATLGNAIIPLPLGRNVGGTTTINSGTCLRLSDDVISHWQQQGWCDFSPQTLAHWYEQVEEVLEVQAAHSNAIGPIGDIIARGASAVGIGEAHALQRNAAGCDGQGLCQFGCPTDAKRSTNVSYVPRALDAGALLLTNTRAVALGNSASGRSVQLRCTLSGEQKTLHARAVVVAMGSLLTPPFLQRNGIRNRWLGRNLSIHPCGLVTAQFADGHELRNSRTIPQGFGVSAFRQQGLMLEGATPPLLAYGLLQKELGDDFCRKMLAYQQTAFFGFMIRDSSRGRVSRWSLGGFPLLFYRMNAADFALFRQGVEQLCRIYLAAGAQSVAPAGSRRLPQIRHEDDLQAFTRMKLKPADFLITAYHPLGTARMAADAAQGVVDQRLQVHGQPGLYVMDGSVLPSSLGANPQLTIMAVCARAAQHLARQLADSNDLSVNQQPHSHTQGETHA